MVSLMDLHTHTISSGHAYSTLKENIEQAYLKGLKILGTSDHAPGMPNTTSNVFFSNYKVIKEEIMGIKILKGIEANIINYKGNIDINQSVIKKLDYIIASLHKNCIKPGSIEENTSAVVGAINNPAVKIIGHPDDSSFPIDYEEMVLEAKKNNVAIELNNSSLKKETIRLNCRENDIKILNLCKKVKAYIILNSDSHIYYDVGDFSLAYDLLKEVDFPEELVINFKEERINYIL